IFSNSFSEGSLTPKVSIPSFPGVPPPITDVSSGAASGVAGPGPSMVVLEPVPGSLAKLVVKGKMMRDKYIIYFIANSPFLFCFLSLLLFHFLIESRGGNYERRIDQPAHIDFLNQIHL